MNGVQQRNLRELLEHHRRPAAWLREVLGLSNATIYNHVLSHGRLGDAEIARLAKALGVPAAVMCAAIAETRIRPGEDRRAGRVGRPLKMPGGTDHGTSLDAGLGTAGDRALAAHG